MTPGFRGHLRVMELPVRFCAILFVLSGNCTKKLHSLPFLDSSSNIDDDSGIRAICAIIFPLYFFTLLFLILLLYFFPEKITQITQEGKKGQKSEVYQGLRAV